MGYWPGQTGSPFLRLRSKVQKGHGVQDKGALGHLADYSEMSDHISTCFNCISYISFGHTVNLARGARYLFGFLVLQTGLSQQHHKMNVVEAPHAWYTVHKTKSVDVI